jgi:hypothetical protein
MLPSQNKRIPSDPASIREIYIDETSQTKHRYLLLGALCAPLLSRNACEDAFASARLPGLPFGELKWAKVSNSKLLYYQRIADMFFEHDAFSSTDFHCVVVDTQKIDDKSFNEGNREIGFNNEIYQAACKCARLYRGLFHLYPDERQTNQRPSDLRQILNWGRRKSGDTRDFPFRRCQFRDSKKVIQLQIVDILLGALAYHVNGHAQNPEASAARIELSQHILRAARITNVMKDTATAGKFTIWHRRLRVGVPRA